VRFAQLFFPLFPRIFLVLRLKQVPLSPHTEVLDLFWSQRAFVFRRTLEISKYWTEKTRQKQTVDNSLLLFVEHVVVVWHMDWWNGENNVDCDLRTVRHQGA